MVGERGRWSPWRHLRERHPEYRVHEVEFATDHLGCVDHRRKVIWLDSRLLCREQRATLAHEIGHIELDYFVQGMWAPAAEYRVDAWAARSLITLPDLLQAFAWSMDLGEMAEELWVDRHTIGVRLRCLTDEEQDAVMDALRRKWVAA